MAVLALPAAVASLGIAAAVRLSSPGPVLFRQERVGHLGRSFTILKFRTMRQPGGRSPLGHDETRVTAVGRVLRRLSLDELPQLWNVLVGEMSIVGPRPTLRYQVDRYDDRQRQRLCVRPGLTGLAQIRGRNQLPWAARIELDIEYVRRASVVVDLGIVFRTIPLLLTGTGTAGAPPDDPLAAVETEPDGTGPGPGT